MANRHDPQNVVSDDIGDVVLKNGKIDSAIPLLSQAREQGIYGYPLKKEVDLVFECYSETGSKILVVFN